MRLLGLLFALGMGCQPAGLTGHDTTRFPGEAEQTETDAPDTDSDSELDPVDDGPAGFVGSPCASDSDCSYADSVCLKDGEGFPRGTCSKPCDKYCPDRDGHPVTFCASEDFAPAPADALGDGACFSRCDYGAFPGEGCRPGYGCQLSERANESWTEQYVCLPGQSDTSLSACQQQLAARGVSFSPTVIPDTSPESHPALTCHVEDPVVLHSPMLGVELKYYDGSVTNSVRASCEMALALADTLDDVKPQGVVSMLHVGTYTCRVISGTNTVSRHGYGDAIDIWGFELSDGSSYTLVDDWEHDDPTPSTPGGAFLYEAAYRWYQHTLWRIILTPDYNSAHDNHFHVDLTPGSHYIGQDGDCGGPVLIGLDDLPDSSWLETKPSGI